jgi:GT2 family glycosyltransferase
MNDQDKKLVSVVIPTFNRRELLAQCLDSVIHQDYSPVEIIVIDDNGSDDTCDFVLIHYPTVNILRNSRNLGPSYSKNRAILAAKGTYVLFLDSDSEMVEKNAISTMADILKTKQGVGQVGGTAVVKAGKIVAAHGCTVGLRGGSRDAVLRAGSSCRFLEVDFVPTCNCMIERKILLEIGGFDSLFRYPSEDRDLGWRLKKKGYKNIIGVEFASVHKVSTVAASRTRFYDWNRARFKFLIKHRGVPVFLLMPFLDGLCVPVEILKTVLKYFRDKSSRMVEDKGNVQFKIRPKLQQGSRLKAYGLAFMECLRGFENTIKSRQADFISRDLMGEYERTMDIRFI